MEEKWGGRGSRGGGERMWVGGENLLEPCWLPFCGLLNLPREGWQGLYSKAWHFFPKHHFWLIRVTQANPQERKKGKWYFNFTQFRTQPFTGMCLQFWLMNVSMLYFREQKCVQSKLAVEWINIIFPLNSALKQREIFLWRLERKTQKQQNHTAVKSPTTQWREPQSWPYWLQGTSLTAGSLGCLPQTPGWKHCSNFPQLRSVLLPEIYSTPGPACVWLTSFWLLVKQLVNS